MPATKAAQDEWFANAVGRPHNPDSSYGLQCHTAGHYVSLADGTYKDIAEVEEGDELFSSDGVTIVTVVKTMQREVETYELRTRTNYITTTAEHPYLTPDGFVEASKLKHKDMLVVPEARADYDHKLTDNELRLLGLWLGDGSKAYRWQGSKLPMVRFTLGTEAKYEYVESLGIPLKQTIHYNGKAQEYHLVNRESPNLAEVIHRIHDKNLPRIFSKEEYEFIIEGYCMADGSAKRGSNIVTSVNKQLLLSIQYGCMLNGWRAILSKGFERGSIEIMGVKCNARPIYRLTINKKRDFSPHVLSVVSNDITETVYNIEVDGDNTYIIDNYAVHNCKDVADDYCIVLFGNWVNTIRPGNGKDVLNNANPAFFTKILNDPRDPNLIPQRGDIIVYSASRAVPEGHVAVVEQADIYGCTVIQQDGYLQYPARRVRLPYILPNGAVTIGWIRPKLEAPRQLATPNQIQEAYMTYLERPADQSGLDHYTRYTIDFVRADLQGSNEYRDLQARKAAAAQAAADAATRLAAEQAEAQRIAEEQAAAERLRQQAIDQQKAVEAAKQNIDHVKTLPFPTIPAAPTTSPPAPSEPADKTQSPLVRFLFAFGAAIFQTYIKKKG